MGRLDIGVFRWANHQGPEVGLETEFVRLGLDPVSIGASLESGSAGSYLKPVSLWSACH